MIYRQLGRSGIQVSVMSLGTMTFGGVDAYEKIGTTGVDVARRQIDMCLDAGVNLIDTANAYSNGRSEEILGEALSDGRRDRALLATKVRFAMGAGPNNAGLSRHHIIAECEASLRRLRTDHIDLYQVHEWDGRTPVEETLEALDTLIRSGKVRYVGCSNFSGWHVMKSLATSDLHGLQRYVSMQIHYTLQARDAEYELLPISVDQGLGVLVWSPLAGGLLSGKYRRDGRPDEGRHLHEDWHEPPVRDTDRLYDLIDALIDIGQAHDRSAAAVALAWLIDRPEVTSLIIGARTEEQLASNLAAVDLQLDAAEIARLNELSMPPLIYPYWHQVVNAPERLGTADLSLLAPHVVTTG